MPLLSELLATLSETPEIPASAHSLTIKGITSDSRQVKRGYIFVALQGSKSTGVEYIEKALDAGAVAIICAKGTPVNNERVTVIRLANPRLALSELAAALYPGQPEYVVAITGTDGKTSTADFYRQFWHHMGASSASIGTLGTLAGDGTIMVPATHTTPDPVALHQLLSDMKQQRITHLAMEASSHGLHQYRLDGVALKAAAFTNIARDHLDYHKDEEDYFNAKARLFESLLPAKGVAVLNADDARFLKLRNTCKKRGIQIIEFGRNAVDLRIDSLIPHGSGQHASLVLLGKPCELDIPLVGGFQVMNILAALGLALATGANMDKALAVIPKFKGVPGRLEHVVTLKSGAAVYVDYAHTPMALANILKTLRPHTKHQLHVVFGCGGDRDAGKRPEMGKAAAGLADQVIVTDDNPRSEDPALIRRAVLAGAAGAKEVADRKEAIYVALRGLGPSDILVIAGKGHEKTQIVGNKVLTFDDVDVAREGAKTLKLVA